jgi:hypothetical protein
MNSTEVHYYSGPLPYTEPEQYHTSQQLYSMYRRKYINSTSITLHSNIHLISYTLLHIHHIKTHLSESFIYISCMIAHF